jgi:LysR family transcriptional regulator, benzoate and cis,cis-muconate-responsive activator of ben and cat genes
MRPLIELRLLQSVITVAEELSFTRAAKKLYMAQPNLSRQIGELESVLGLKLFDRSTRQVTLTPPGIAFVEEARAALIHSERAASVAKAVARGQDSSLSIGYSPHFNLDLFAAIKKRSILFFGPEGIVFTSSFTQEQVQKVCDGMWDAGLCFLPIDEPTLETTLLKEEDVGVVVPKDHKLARHNGQVRLREFENDAVILFSRRINPTFSRELEKFWATVGYNPKITQDVRTIAEALSLVAAGVGIAFIRYSLEKILPPSLKMLNLPIQERMIVKTGLIYRTNGCSARLDKFLNLVTGLARNQKALSAKAR